MPLLVGGFLELPLGVLAGQGRRRRLAILGGGVIFVLTLLGVASARSFTVLLCAFVAFYPASGAFVSLTQAEIIDGGRPGRPRSWRAGTWPDQRGRWGAAACSPRSCWPAAAARGPATWCWPGWPRSSGSARTCGARRTPARRARQAQTQTQARLRIGEGSERRPWTERAREIAAALRDWGTLRWLLLLEVADLLVDVFTGFLALYLVDVAHLTPAVAALAIAIRLGAALAGDAGLVVVLERAGDLTVLRASAAAAALLYPGFLLVPGAVPKLVVLAALSAVTAPWYPILQARLYGSLPGEVRWR